MDALIGLLGFFGFIVFLILTVISGIKKNGKTKKFAKGILASFVMVCVALTMPSSNDNTITAVAAEKNQNSENNTKVEIQDKKQTQQDKKENSNSEAIVTNTEKETAVKTEVSGEVKIHYIDVGQADSILIQQSDSAMLIDAGNNADSDLVVNYLKKQGISKLDYVIGTHPHEDHIGGLDVVINTFDIGKVFMPKATSTTKTFKYVVTAIKNKGLKITAPKVGDEYTLGEANWTILAPNSAEYDDVNNASIVTKLKFGNKAFIFTGDAEDVSEGEILAKQLDISGNVLKIGHHGSESSTTEGFLNKVNPKYAVVSVGKDNKYAHPHKETMERLKAKGIEVYRTDESGTITCTSNGTDITFNTDPDTFKYKDNNSDSSSEVKEEAKQEPKPEIKEEAKEEVKEETEQEVKNESSKEAVIISNIDKKGEVVVITNTSNTDIDLSAWRIISVTGNQSYSFSSYVLKAGASVKVASGDMPGDLKWGRGNVWNNSKSDPGELYDNNGNLVYRYND